MNDTILRFLTMLRMLPRAPRKLDTATMARKLRDEGYTVTRRTIQRDLHQLARTFPLLCDEHRPAGWSWAPDAALIDLPGMDPNTALTFVLVVSLQGAGKSTGPVWQPPKQPNGIEKGAIMAS